MKRMRINGVGLHVEPPAGDGELLVFVHGGWTDHATWAALVPTLSQSFRVVTTTAAATAAASAAPGLRRGARTRTTSQR